MKRVACTRRLAALLPAWLLLATGGCHPLVGGPCTYETVITTAMISSRQEEVFQARILPGELGGQHSRLSRSPDMEFAVRLPIAGGIGTRYPAELSAITSGSCTPYRFRLLASEASAIPFFLPLDRKGRFTPASRRTLAQIARVFGELAPHGPQLAIEICGQTEEEGSAEYNLNLAGRHARQFANQLTEQGVPADRLHTTAAGEESCAMAEPSADKPRNGAWLRFRLH